MGRRIMGLRVHRAAWCVIRQLRRIFAKSRVTAYVTVTSRPTIGGLICGAAGGCAVKPVTKEKLFTAWGRAMRDWDATGNAAAVLWSVGFRTGIFGTWRGNRISHTGIPSKQARDFFFLETFAMQRVSRPGDQDDGKHAVIRYVRMGAEMEASEMLAVQFVWLPFDPECCTVSCCCLPSKLAHPTSFRTWPPHYTSYTTCFTPVNLLSKSHKIFGLSRTCRGISDGQRKYSGFCRPCAAYAQ